MIRAGLAALVMMCAAGCTTDTRTYRELERMGAEYERGGASPLAPREDSCGIAQHRALIGIEQSAIDPASLPQGARVVCHDCSVTMDHVPARLNVHIGADGKVASLRCG